MLKKCHHGELKTLNPPQFLNIIQLSPLSTD